MLRPQPLYLVCCTLLWACAVAESGCSGGSQACAADAKLDALLGRLDETGENMRSRRLTLQALESVRSSVLSGQRILLPAGARQHLAKGNPLVSEVSYSSKHRPVNANTSQHVHWLRTIAENLDVRHMAYLPLKKSASDYKKGAASLLVLVDQHMRLALYTMEGDVLLDGYDLGHSNQTGVEVKYLVLSPNQESHFVLTADSLGEMRVHNLKIVARRERKEREEDDDDFQVSTEIRARRQLVVTANFSCSFFLPFSEDGAIRELTSILPVDRNSQVFFAVGDADGGISVFNRNGTMRGRVIATDDPGGIIGLARGQSQSVIFYSAHRFGFFSTYQIDVQFAPCTGWNTPLYDFVPDPNSGTSRMILSLVDGDVLVFNTMHGKSRTCDLFVKFPRVSNVPLKLTVFRGHVVGLMSPAEGFPSEDYMPEILFFNLNSMEEGYGIAPSRTVVMQVNFKPLQPVELLLQSGSGERSRGQLMVRSKGSKGIDIYDIALKQPPAPSMSIVGSDSDGWLSWFPKFGVFGIVLLGVFIWNVCKYTGWGGDGDMGGLDDAELEARIKEMAKAEGIDLNAKDFGGGSGGGSSGGGGLGGGGLGMGNYDDDD